MAACVASPVHTPTLLSYQLSSLSSSNTVCNLANQKLSLTKTTRKARAHSLTIAASSNSETNPSEKSTKLVTFLGKGGSGKTTAAVFAAQHYAKEGLSTCLVSHSQDLTAEYLLNCKLRNDPVLCSDNLYAVRLETTKMLLEPLKRLKKADAHINMTQGTLEWIVGEELGVLPGMDSIFSAFALEKFIGFLEIKPQESLLKEKFDIVIYDGISSEETLRMMSAARSARLYVKYLRNIAEKTDFGRLAGPSLLRLVDEAMSLNSSSGFDGRMSSEIWDSVENVLEKGASAFADPQKFGCYIIADPCNAISVETALRYWGCTIQAGANISGVLGVAPQQSCAESVDSFRKSFLPAPFALIPNLSEHSSLEWDYVLSVMQSEDAKNLLHPQKQKPRKDMSSIKFDPVNKSITLFMPGFDKSEIKLYQYRGGSELLVEAGDQRRVIMLPREIQGKVGGAKFADRSLVITMQ